MKSPLAFPPLGFRLSDGIGAGDKDDGDHYRTWIDPIPLQTLAQLTGTCINAPDIQRAIPFARLNF